MRHVLKTIDTVWFAVQRGEKTFEVRRNDRFFQRGDHVVLRRINERGYPESNALNGGLYHDLEFTIGWMLQGGQFGVEPGYCVFQLVPMQPEAPTP